MWNLDQKIDEWTKRRFLMRSGYYAGRGPNTGDLNSEILEAIYQGIKNDFGQDAATNFVRFVNQLNDLSASAFIVAFERFGAKEGKVVTVEQRSDDGMRLDAHDDAMMAQGFGAIMSSLGGRDRSPEALRRAHGAVKNDFIRRHEAEIPGAERRPMDAFGYA